MSDENFLKLGLKCFQLDVKLSLLKPHERLLWALTALKRHDCFPQHTRRSGRAANDNIAVIHSYCSSIIFEQELNGEKQS
jgi:hypothetical protein